MKRSICLALIVCTGCVKSPSPKPEIVSSKVTVSTSGKEVNDFEREFIHRVELGPAQLEKLSRFDNVKDSYDQFGKVVGLKLLGDLPALSMQQGDVLTAIGKKVVQPGDSLSLLRKEIIKGESSITFLRVGRAYKTLIKIR